MSRSVIRRLQNHVPSPLSDSDVTLLIGKCAAVSSRPAAEGRSKADKVRIQGGEERGGGGKCQGC